jgi:hypothetical protein
MTGADAEFETLLRDALGWPGVKEIMEICDQCEELVCQTMIAARLSLPDSLCGRATAQIGARARSRFERRCRGTTRVGGLVSYAPVPSG